MSERELSRVELGMWLLGKASPFNITALLALTEALEPTVIEAAVERAVAAHPMLQVGVHEGGDGSYWLRRQEGRAGNASFRCTKEEAGGVAESEINTAFSADEPLFRFVYCDAPDAPCLVATAHHAVSDGKSVVAVLESIAAALEGAAAPGDADRSSLPAPLDDRVPRSISGWRGLLACLRLIAQHGFQMVVLRPRKLPSESTGPEPPAARNRLYPLSFEPDLTRRLVAAARARGTTLQGVLCAALMESVADPIRRSYRARTVPIGCISGVSLRAELEPPVADDVVGFFVTGPATVHRVPGKSGVWGTASELKSRLTAANEAMLPLASVILQSRLSSPRAIPASVHARAERFVRAAVGVTNLGVISAPTLCNSPLIRDLRVTVGTAGMSTTVVAFAATLRGRLNVDLLYREPYISEATVRSVAADFRATLTRAADVAQA